MTALSEMAFDDMSLHDCVIAVSQIIYEDFPVQQVREQFAELSAEARATITDHYSDDRLKQLIKLFYGEWQFRVSNTGYQVSEAMKIDKALQTRTGSAVSLGIIFLVVAHALNIPIMPFIVVRQLILRGEWMCSDPWLMDPATGMEMDEYALEVWLRADSRSFMQLGIDALQVAETESIVGSDNKNIALCILRNLKHALAEEGQVERALHIANLIIELEPDNPHEIRDRGFLCARLSCASAALADLEYYLAKCPEERQNEMLISQLDLLLSKQVVYH